jgi:predicted nucleic acid-binding protein
MKLRIYIETSVISYLAARPSSDAVNMTRQFQSLRLWQAQDTFDLLISELVMQECLAGDAAAAQVRMNFCNQLAKLPMLDAALPLARQLVDAKVIPENSFVDAVHIAVASVHEMDFIASWNFKHIAGAIPRQRVEACLRALAAHVPMIATPEEILESKP